MRPCDLILFCGRFGVLWAIFFAILAAPPEPSNLHRNITGPVPKTAAHTHTHARTQILQLKHPNQRQIQTMTHARTHSHTHTCAVFRVASLVFPGGFLVLPWYFPSCFAGRILLRVLTDFAAFPYGFCYVWLGAQTLAYVRMDYDSGRN